MRSDGHQRALRVLTAILAIAVLVSIVHYYDNYVNYDDYPLLEGAPNPSAEAILVSWFAFTAAGIAGYLLFRRSASRLALLLLAVYSGSGLVGFGHYVAPGALDMPWWRHAHVLLDIVFGIAIFAFAIWATRADLDDRAASPLRQSAR